MSTSNRATTSATWLEVPQHRQAVERVGGRVVLVGRQAAADDPVAVVGLAVHLLVQGGDRVPMADQHRGLQTFTPAPGPVQEPALQIPLSQRQQGGEGDGDDHEAAGDVQPERPGDGAQRREQHHRGEEDPAELLGAHPEEALLVAAGDQHGADPDDRQREGRPGRGMRRRHHLHTEPDEVAGQPGYGRAEDVADDDPPDVVAAPGPAGLGAFTAEACGVRLPAPSGRPLGARVIRAHLQ